MTNTLPILLTWDKGQAFAERMSRQVLGLEGYTDIDPQSPMGGPDGLKDIICSKVGKKFIVGCYFPSRQQKFSAIKTKFRSDFSGVIKNTAHGFIFITNQRITPAQRKELSKTCNVKIIIFHGERIAGILDSPEGYSIRYEYLGIEPTTAELMALCLGAKKEREEIKKTLTEIHTLISKTCLKGI
ncbi:MAG: hypothetical protein J0H74_27530 [Chitinophagaceae bacterium]|nr:hypothetical protein [Chitinophagaceae bacterium]